MLKKILGFSFVFVLTVTCVSAQTLAEKKAEYNRLLEQNNVMMKNLDGSSPEQIQKLNALRQRINQLHREIQQESQQQNRKNIEYNRQQVYKEIDAFEKVHIQLMENLKTCTKSSAKLIFGTYAYVLGPKNGACYYQQAVGSKDIICAFPMSVAKVYAQETINSIRTGKASSYVESATNKYCKLKQ